MSVDVSLLRRQRTTVLNGISNSKGEINKLADKISRLQTASNKLTSLITELETCKSNINNLSLNKNRWKGAELNKFNNRYVTYEGHVGNLVKQTINAKDTIDDEIRRFEQSKNGYLNGLATLESTLYSLNMQISNAERR